MRKTIVAALASMLLLAGCGSELTAEAESGAVTPDTGTSKGSIRVFDVDVNGKSVTCVESYVVTGYGAGAGLSCDFSTP